jgi:general secretion pathway protein A
MYHAHFGLREEPFGVSPDRRFFFQTEQHREAVATLYYAIQQRRGFALLVGQPGLGKTSVLVQLLQFLEGKAETAYLPHPYFDRTTVLESILESVGIQSTASPARNHRLFYDYLMEARRAGKTCAIIFDEAQELNRDTLEAIRMLSNFETLTEKLVQIVLAGQPGLAETLKQPDCDQIRQRLNVVARLKPLTPQEVYAYMAHRLQVAGAVAPLFDQDALQAIATASAGVPRNINTICFNSLSLAYALNHHQVGRPEVAEAVADLDLFPADVKAEVKVEAKVEEEVKVGQTLSSGNPPISARDPESTVAFPQVHGSLRVAWIAGAMLLLVFLSVFIRVHPWP